MRRVHVFVHARKCVGSVFLPVSRSLRLRQVFEQPVAKSWRSNYPKCSSDHEMQMRFNLAGYIELLVRYI